MMTRQPTIPPQPISKIAFFCDFYSSLGGTESYNTKLITELLKEGLEVRVYIGEKPRAMRWINQLRKMGVQVKVPQEFHDDMRSNHIEQKLIEEITPELRDWRPDLIFVHPFKKMAITWLKNKPKDLVIPIVATEWTVPAITTSHWFDPETKEYINNVSAYIATCRAAHHGIRHYHGYKGVIHDIPHLLSIAPTSQLTARSSGAIRPYSVGCIARLSVEKGIVFLLGAWRQVILAHPNAILSLYGHGSDKALLIELSACLGIQDNVIFAGTFKPGEIEAIALKHDFFVQPSLFESISTASIELMLCRRTIIATNVGGMSELVLDGETGILVSPGSTDQLADAMLRLLNDDSLLARLNDSAFDYTSLRYNNQKNFQKIMDLFQFVANSK